MDQQPFDSNNFEQFRLHSFAQFSPFLSQQQQLQQNQSQNQNQNQRSSQRVIDEISTNLEGFQPIQGSQGHHPDSILAKEQAKAAAAAAAAAATAAAAANVANVAAREQYQHQHHHHHHHHHHQNQLDPIGASGIPNALAGQLPGQVQGRGSFPIPGGPSGLNDADVSLASAVATAATATSEDSKLPRATLQQKIDVLDWYHASDKKSQQHTVTHFQQLKKFAITKSSFNRWLKEEPKLRKEFKNLSFTYRSVYKTKPNLKNPETNRALEIFYEQNLYEKNIDHVSERMLLKKFEKFALMFDANFDISKAKRSNGWLHHFKRKNIGKKNLILKFFLEQDRIFSIKFLNAEKVRIKNALKNYIFQDIYHFDELKVTSDLPGIKLFDDKKLKISELLVGLCVNADGSDFRDPLIVGKDGYQRDVRLKNASNYYQHPSVSITTEIFHEYISKWDKEIEKLQPTRKICILVDTLYAHIIPTEELKHIELIYFSPNFISYLSYPSELFNKNVASLTEVIPDPHNKTNFSFITKNVVLLNSNVRKLGKLEIQPISLGLSRIFKSYFKLNLFEYYLSQLICYEGESTDTVGNFSSFALQNVVNAVEESDLIYFISEAWEALKSENEKFEKNIERAENIEGAFTMNAGAAGAATTEQNFEKFGRKNIVSNCFKNSDILPYYNLINLTSDVNSNPINPIIFSDYSKEFKLLQILKVFELKNLIKLERRKPYLSLSRAQRSDYLPLKIEDVLFPNEEFVLNKHMSDEEIVEMVKEEMRNFDNLPDTSSLNNSEGLAKRKEQDAGQSFIGATADSSGTGAFASTDNPLRQIGIVNTDKPDQTTTSSNGTGAEANSTQNQSQNNNGLNTIEVDELIKISRLLNKNVKGFLNTNSNEFSKSNYYFKNFLISFILESNDFLLNSSQFGDLNNVERDFEKFFVSLNKKYGRNKSKHPSANGGGASTGPVATIATAAEATTGDAGAEGSARLRGPGPPNTVTNENQSSINASVLNVDTLFVSPIGAKRVSSNAGSSSNSHPDPTHHVGLDNVDGTLNASNGGQGGDENDDEDDEDDDDAFEDADDGESGEPRRKRQNTGQQDGSSGNNNNNNDGQFAKKGKISNIINFSQ